MGTQAKDGRGYGSASVMSKMESVGICNCPQSEAGNRKAMACLPAIHYDNSSTCLWLLEIEYATLDTSLKQGCQQVFLPYFSICVEGGLTEAVSSLLSVDLLFYSSSCKCQVAAQPHIYHHQ